MPGAEGAFGVRRLLAVFTARPTGQTRQLAAGNSTNRNLAALLAARK
jgi:hypothetical protein